MDADWLKFKKYPHIGDPLSKRRDSGWIFKYVTDPKNIAKHKFTPLLHKVIHQRKYRPNKDAVKNRFGKKQRSVQKPKQRPIFYASHLDAMVYSYYSEKLTASYEDYLLNKDFGKCAVAYRKIPIGKESNGNKCNVEFAFETFQFIEKNKHRQLSMIVSDVTSFFDNLDHRILHQQWKKILNVDSLPDDHYNVYKSIISKRYVNELELFKKFQHKLIVQRGVKNKAQQTRLVKKKVKHIWNVKKEKVVAYCSKKDFFREAKNLIRTEKKCSHQHRRCRWNCEIRGIPQGTPMSASLANIYMLDFDKIIYEFAEKRNAYYQRYSDDLIIVCDQKDEQFFFQLIRDKIENLTKLEIQREKTKIYRYQNENGRFNGGILNETGETSSNMHLEYLGFQYDGTKVKVKTVGFSRFYRAMKRSIRRGVHFAAKSDNQKKSLFEERLYKRFTHKGAKRRLIYKPDAESETGYSKSKEQYWGNYISYLEKANRIMKPINRDDTIKMQYSKFWPNFGIEMKKAKNEIIARSTT